MGRHPYVDGHGKVNWMILRLTVLITARLRYFLDFSRKVFNMHTLHSYTTLHRQSWKPTPEVAIRSLPILPG
jgi:hypothetical protein